MFAATTAPLKLIALVFAGRRVADVNRDYWRRTCHLVKCLQLPEVLSQI